VLMCPHCDTEVSAANAHSEPAFAVDRRSRDTSVPGGE
jgi:hypothetical protein